MQPMGFEPMCFGWKPSAIPLGEGCNTPPMGIEPMVPDRQSESLPLTNKGITFLTYSYNKNSICHLSLLNIHADTPTLLYLLSSYDDKWI